MTLPACEDGRRRPGPRRLRTTPTPPTTSRRAGGRRPQRRAPRSRSRQLAAVQGGRRGGPAPALGRLQGDRATSAARAADPALRAAGQVRRRPGRRGPAAEHRAGRPGLLRHLRADRRDREVRPRARRSSSRPTRSAGSAARSSTSCAHRLDPALGPLQGPRGREGVRPRSRPSCTARRPSPRSPRRWASAWPTCTRSSARSPSSTWWRSTSCSTSAARRATSSASSTPSRTTKAEDPVAAFESEETKYLLAGAINTLPEREKIVVTLYYYEGLTLAEIGQVLGVTESRICQMHTKAVLQLRGKLAEQRD